MLEVLELPIEDLQPGEVRIRVHAAAINPTDIAFRSGAYRNWVDYPPPYVPGMDAAGTVEAVGEGVDLRPGTEVMAVVAPTRPSGGAYTELLTIPSAQVIAIPEGASLEQAATLPMNGLTAKVVLDVLALSPGQKFGVLGAAGVLGSYAIGLAKHRGLQVFADAKPEDEDLVRSFGADVIVPRGKEVGIRMREASNGGVDGLLNGSVQGREIFPAVRDGGHIAAIRPFEFESERDIALDMVLVFEHLHDHAGLTLVRDLASRGLLQLRVADTFAPEDAAEAHRRFDAGGVRGRLLLSF